MRKALVIFVVLVSGIASAQIDYHISLRDNLPTASTYSDSVSAGRGGTGSASITDTLSITMKYVDSVTIRHSRGAPVSETFTYSDSVIRGIGRIITPDALTVIDRPTLIKGSTVSNAKSVADTLTVNLIYSDAVSALKNHAGSASIRSASDTLTFSDVANHGSVINLSDSFILTSSVCANSHTNGLQEVLIEQDHVTINAVSGGISNSRQLTDSLFESDTARKQVALSIFPAESFIYIDLVSGPFQTNPVLITDTFTFSDHVSSPFQTSTNFESFTYSDSVIASSTHAVRVNDGLIFTDGIKACTSSGSTNCHRKGQIIARLGEIE